jgi:nucleoside triphosphate pyrophosphatase
LELNWPPLILASGSPRRQFLLKAAGIPFTVAPPHIEEHFPRDMPREQVAAYVATCKAKAVSGQSHAITLAADTTVLCEDTLLEKPRDRAEAIRMLERLSGKTHDVITGVCLFDLSGETVFSERTSVTFRALPANLIETYVDGMKPYDKAGAYGIQECLPPGFDPFSAEEKKFLDRIHQQNMLAMILSGATDTFPFVDAIKGSFFNVMGLPIDRVYEVLQGFSKEA